MQQAPPGVGEKGDRGRGWYVFCNSRNRLFWWIRNVWFNTWHSFFCNFLNHWIACNFKLCQSVLFKICGILKQNLFELLKSQNEHLIFLYNFYYSLKIIKHQSLLEIPEDVKDMWVKKINFRLSIYKRIHASTSLKHAYKSLIISPLVNIPPIKLSSLPKRENNCGICTQGSWIYPGILCVLAQHNWPSSMNLHSRTF